MDPNQPPPTFGEDETGVLVTSADRPPQRPHHPVPNYPRQPHPDPVGPPLKPRRFAWFKRWMVPVAIIALGLIGVGLFMALSLKKAKDELATAQASVADAKAERETLTRERDDAVAEAREAKKKAAGLSKKLKVAVRDASKAKLKVKKIDKKADQLEKKLRTLAKETASEVSRDGDRLTLKLVDKVLFRSGESDLTRRGKRYLKKVGAALKKADDKQIWVQGHTDNVPVSKNNSKFASNWELSSARALTVVHFLEDEVGISGKRLAAVAFSKYRPVSRRRKARNRRIEIVLAPRTVRLR